MVSSEVNITLVQFIRGQEEWLRQELDHLWTPLFLALQEALTLYYREIAELGLPATPPTLEVAAISPAPGPGDAPVGPGAGARLAFCP